MLCASTPSYLFHEDLSNIILQHREIRQIQTLQDKTAAFNPGTTQGILDTALRSHQEHHEAQMTEGKENHKEGVESEKETIHFGKEQDRKRALEKQHIPTVKKRELQVGPRWPQTPTTSFRTKSIPRVEPPLLVQSDQKTSARELQHSSNHSLDPEHASERISGCLLERRAETLSS